ncbi:MULTISPECIES: LCP family protein [unclassified Paenibacillus]|uniref:LCP family protein n=1 Tax=unclassified Paenibacillus TaxID=185978 RepID=UPI001C1189D8|nr:MULTISPECIES: LCP family protein [unclassified Paenibacillus]MBU5441921.1 LCP family protein [Paenibacillus sp. MSJ-34]CAH0121330.1 Polyisoprenyl-teichoic acid--peptidoglycan teichoic acid transferase TagU [Paenibacillus sp. CECT 9249]
MKNKKLYIILLVVVLLGAGGYLFRKELAVLAFDIFLSNQVEKKLENSFQPIEGQENEKKEPKIGPFSTLLLGTDARGNERGRSDTIIYTVVRPEAGKVLMISIPRDTYAEIVGKDKMDKINHAFAYGGAQMSINSVEKLVGYPVDHYATVNFEGFKELVDALGGIKLPIEEDIVNKGAGHEKFTVKAGKPLYSGQEALYFVRYREDDHINRASRNMIFLKAVMDRMTGLDQVTKIPELIESMGDNFKTDIPPKDMIEIAKKFYKHTGYNVYNYTLRGEGGMTRGVWYYMPDEDDVQYIQELIANWMDPNVSSQDLMLPKA